MLLQILIIIILTIILIVKLSIQESFSNKSNNHIWMYWETKKGSKKADYLNLCYQTIVKHCSDYQVHLLNEKSVHDYLPNLNMKLLRWCSIPQKADYIRLSLLYKYGGYWLDSDIIVFKSFRELFLLLDTYDFVGFGCHFSNCHTNTNGFPKPANWVIGSRKNGLLMSRCLAEANHILSHNPQLLKINYHCLGRELLWSEINYLLKNNSSWKYYHFDSKCIERDSSGNKIYNSRHISKEEIDKKCQNKFIFIPIYNTAPGFPSWFKNMSSEDLLKSDFLFSKLINYSLSK